MNRREFVISTSGVAVALFTPYRIAGQKKTIELDLTSLADGKGLNASKRTRSTTGGHSVSRELVRAGGERQALLAINADLATNEQAIST